MSKKFRLTKFVTSMESEAGAAVVVDVKETSAALEKPEVGTPAEGAKAGNIDNAHKEVDAGGKDYTAMDAASERQGEAIHKQMERLSQAETSLEAYGAILRDSLKKGGAPSLSTIAVIKHDLAQQYPKYLGKVVPSLEDSEESDSRQVATQVSGNIAEKTGGVKKAIVEAWKKFWAWVKERWNKLTGMMKKIFGRAKVVKDGNQKMLSNPKAAPEVMKALGATPRAAQKEQGGDVKEGTVEPKDEGEQFSGHQVGILASSRNDPFDKEKKDIAVMTAVYKQWILPTKQNVEALAKVLIGDGSALQSISVGTIKSAIKDIKFESPADMLPGNHHIVVTDNGWSFKLAQDAEPEPLKSVPKMDLSTIKNVLMVNDDLLDVSIDIGEAWTSILATLDKVTAESNAISEAGAGGEVKKVITSYVSGLVNSNVVQLTGLMIRVTTARLLLCCDMGFESK